MFPLQERAAFRPRYSQNCHKCASRFAHGDVREFFVFRRDQDRGGGRNQNSGGICATRNGPRNTAPSTKRSGKARAFLPSSSASVPSELMPAATPTLAFCWTALPRPGIARSSALNKLV